jgi:hypothetical protein
MKRRHFLQSTSSMLATLGLSQIDLATQATRYGQVLAKDTPRKLALLVGINAYSGKIPALKGCLTDLEMQYMLLVHRFGFKPEDIKIVADKWLPFMKERPLEPTRQNILEAFEHHLINQEKSGDVVLFHFSGHGSQVEDPDAADPTHTNSDKKSVSGTIVPSDRTLPDGTVQDIMGRTLFLLTSALKTDNVTLILDSCHSGGATRNPGYQIRSVESRPQGDFAPINRNEIEFQKTWLKKLNPGLSAERIQELRRANIAKGVTISSTQYNQFAVDAAFDEGQFYAGAFTYLLTRYLWQATGSTVGNASGLLTQRTQNLADQSHLEQIPTFQTNPASNSSQPMYFLPPQSTWADAVVQHVAADGKFQYWLGGTSALSLVASQPQSAWTAIDPSGQEIGEIVQENRQGLHASGKLSQGKLQQIKPGTLLRERIRNVPNNFKLRLALHSSLGKDWKVAEQLLKNHPTISLLSEADYLLGRYTDKPTSTLAANSIGIFQPGLIPLQRTFNTSGESISDAITRLQASLKSLLVGQLLKLVTRADILTQGNTSRFKIKAAVVPADQPGIDTPDIIPLNRPLQVRVQNQDPDHDLYVAILAINGSGSIVPIYSFWDSQGEEILYRGDTLKTPKEGAKPLTASNEGEVEILVLAGDRPIGNALKALQSISQPGDARRSASEDDQLEALQLLLSSFDETVRSERALPDGMSAVDIQQMAAISIPLSIRRKA